MSEKLELASLLSIKKNLDRMFGKETWVRWEPETISMELNVVFTPLLLDKLNLLRILNNSPLLPFEDPALFLYAAEVINNNVADFQSVPHLTILEAGYAIHAIEDILRDDKVSIEYPDALKKACTYILNMEGSSSPIPPFSFIKESDLQPGQTKEDTEAKNKAMAAYFNYMDNL